MLYQKILTGSTPYMVSIGNSLFFETHRHHEIELSCCMEGSYDILCENKRHTLCAGDFALILPMASHGIPQQKGTTCRRLTVNLGYALLGEYFDFFVKHTADCQVIRAHTFGNSETFCAISQCIKETAKLKKTDTPFNELFIKSNMYKLSGLLLQLLQETSIVSIPVRRLHDIKKSTPHWKPYTNGTMSR